MLLLLLGCDTLDPTWIDQRPACAAEPYTWADDLESWVLAGPGDGSFDLDPADEPRTGLSGSYDPATGDFAWSVAFADEYWLDSSEVSDGFGTAWHNGDLDVEFTVQTTDMLGNSSSTGNRVLREGCAETRWSWDATADEPTFTELNGTWSAHSFDWTVASDSAEWSGSLADDLTRTTDYVVEGDDEHVVDHPDGTSDREFAITGDTYDYAGSSHTAFDGSYTSDYAITQNGKSVCDVTEAHDYSGDGTAHYDCGNDSFDCDYTVKDDGSCSYTCTDGEKGSC